ncbi:hypothetical protein BH10PSE13_BH10PSE13_03510 [soil metagenome]
MNGMMHHPQETVAKAAHSIREDYNDLLEGADPVASDLWRWHPAEEFEERRQALAA